MSEHLRDQWRKVAMPTDDAFLETLRWSHGPLAVPYVAKQYMVRCKTADGTLIGHMRWLAKDYKRPPGKKGEITYVFVDPAYQRRGVATEMLRKARMVDPDVHHSGVLTEDGEAWSQVAASLITEAAFGNATLWHVTDRRDFTLDPEHQPGGGNGEVGLYGAGLFVTSNPELWHYLWRPMSSSGIYAAEIEAPASVVQTLGGPGDDRDQAFIGPSGLDQVTVKRVVPIGQAEAEANRAGYGFAMIAADVIERSRICVIDHKAGWGNPMALCERITDGNPIKWTTVEWVKTGPITDRICPDCLEALR